MDPSPQQLDVSTEVDAPGTEKKCNSWCESRRQDWKHKCKWAGCAGCGDCVGEFYPQQCNVTQLLLMLLLLFLSLLLLLFVFNIRFRLSCFES